jgi:prepilin-type N-terminal cleavage/methylation domain-containing protein
MKHILNGKVDTGVKKFRLSIKQPKSFRLFGLKIDRIYKMNVRLVILKLRNIRLSRIFAKRQALQDQSGFTLVEVLVAIVLLSLIVIGILATAASAYRMVRSVDARETANNYAEWEMEYIKNQPYSTSNQYTAATNSPYPSNYTVQSIVATPVTTIEQQISITITGNGTTYTLSDYKVNY